MRKIHRAGAITLLVTGVVPISVAEVTIAPDVHISADHSSNKQLQLDNEDSVQGYIAEANVDIKHDTSTWLSTLSTQLQSRHYNSGADLGSDDQNVTAASTHKGQTSQTEIQITAINDTTLSDQLNFSGYTEVLKRRRYLSGGISHQWHVTPRDRWLFDYDASGSRYLDAEDTNLIDYRFDTATTTFQHHISTAFAAYAALGRSEYEADDIGNSSKSEDLSLGALWRPSLPSLVKAGLGQRRTAYSYFDGIFELDDEYTYATFEWARDLPGGNITFKTQDFSQPTGDGSLYRTRRASVDFYSNLDTRQVIGISCAYGQQRASAQEFSNSDRDNAQITVSYRYRVSRDLGIQTIVTYRDQTYLTLDERAVAYDAWLGVYWAPSPYRW